MSFDKSLLTKWQDTLDTPGLPQFRSQVARQQAALLLEQTELDSRSLCAQDPSGFMQTRQSLNEDPLPTNYMGASSSTTGDGNIDIFDPIMISMARRALPNLMPYDVMGVQPMTGPTGLIFALRSRYANQTGPENFYNEVNGAFSTVVSGANTLGQKQVGTVPGDATHVSNLAATGIYNYAQAMATAQLEALGTDSNTAIPQMAFSIEKVEVLARGRALAAEYTMELAQDLKAVHGLDAETELSNILSAELLADINREAVRTIFVTAKSGSQKGTITPGVFDLNTDSSGRWSVEKFKGLMYQIERECNKIAKDTRRGKGNILICSSDVASALEMTGKLSYTPRLNDTSLQVDDTGNTFAGVLGGRIKVYIDPYATDDFFVVGYKGSSTFDAGIFYCPYVPLQMVRAVFPNSFQPTIGFKTRYGMVANPYAQGLTAGKGALVADSNVYYRRTIISNIL